MWPWRRLRHTSEARVSCTLSLTNGQAFCWWSWGDGTFTGVLGPHLVTLRTSDDVAEHQAAAAAAAATAAAAVAATAAAAASSAPAACTDSFRDDCPAGGLWYMCDPDADAAVATALADYFQLATPLEPLLKQWTAADTRAAAIIGCMPGLRVLRQDPFECLISFICSSNNNISRISQNLFSLREKCVCVRVCGRDGRLRRRGSTSPDALCTVPRPAGTASVLVPLVANTFTHSRPQVRWRPLRRRTFGRWALGTAPSTFDRPHKPWRTCLMDCRRCG